MERKILFWILEEEKIDRENRYCSKCKKEVTFYDSSVRRHNANGKSIYQFAIYKCEKGHTWNKKLNQYKANSVNDLSDINTSHTSPYLKNESYRRENKIETGIEKIALKDVQSENIKELSIVIQGRVDIRLDKLLAEHIIDRSRCEIQFSIKKGKIKVNGEKIKPKYKINNNDNITILL